MEEAKLKVRMSKADNAKFYDVDVDSTIELPLEDYVVGVVASEVGNSHVEACKAQAVAARTNAYNYLLQDKPISDASGSVQCFNAARARNAKAQYPNAYQGTMETAGEVLTYQGKVIQPCSFSASNGGKTTSSKDRWGGYRAWLIAQDDPWDLAATGGKKSGHGVGMSQAGAKYAAKTGCSYRDILSFYYPNTQVTKTHMPDGSNSDHDKNDGHHEDKKGDGEPNMANTVKTVKASYLVEKFKYMLDHKWKYVAGGAKEGAVDCSGAFTYWYAQAGSYMYHGSNTMWRKYSVQKGAIGTLD